MSKFIKIGESLINLEWVRAVEHSGDGRLNVYLSEDRAGGLTLRYSGEEARVAWAALCDPRKIDLIDAGDPVDPQSSAASDGQVN